VGILTISINEKGGGNHVEYESLTSATAIATRFRLPRRRERGPQKPRLFSEDGEIRPQFAVLVCPRASGWRSDPVTRKEAVSAGFSGVSQRRRSEMVVTCGAHDGQRHSNIVLRSSVTTVASFAANGSLQRLQRPHSRGMPLSCFRHRVASTFERQRSAAGLRFTRAIAVLNRKVGAVHHSDARVTINIADHQFDL
jgi:hypothetical protein